MSAVVLTTERLRLRPFARDDVDALQAQWTQLDVRRYLWDGRVIARPEVVAVVEESIASFATRGIGFWVIEARGAAIPVGFVGLRAIPGTADIELYYGLEPAHWGCGFATEASRAVLRYALEAVGVEHVYVRMDGPNLRSVEVTKRLGADWVRTEATGAFGSTLVYVVRRAGVS
ncbi:MAG TPA: GNAT family N-acetyltransferase [Candidatus Binatia bacterium]|nr:GNAT family N-acetyltransferase [Candidatus Binatia bacterium]